MKASVLQKLALIRKARARAAARAPRAVTANEVVEAARAVGDWTAEQLKAVHSRIDALERDLNTFIGFPADAPRRDKTTGRGRWT